MERLAVFLALIVIFFTGGCALNLKGGYAPAGDAGPDVTNETDGAEFLPDTDAGDIEQEFGCIRDSDCTDGNPCNGVEICSPTTHECIPGSAREDGTVCGDSPRKICLSSACVESTCGDLFTDRGAGEFCDDGNSDPNDGCNGCLISCIQDSECRDEEICNGDEICNLTTARCENGTPLAEGMECESDPRKICISQLCTDSICGDGFIDEPSGERCEGDYSLECTASCGTTGAQYCSGCRWSGCFPPAEICNGADDDCDSLPDNGLGCVQNEPGVPCTTTCGSTGTGICTFDCQVPGPGSCTPPGETCNGADDDCDGSSDDGLACVQGATDVPCTTACGSTGTGTCTFDCLIPEPSACTPPGEIACNGADDDCDGACDEESQCCRGTSGSCTTWCGTTGSRTCNSGCAWDPCQIPAEVCNGSDDDCDGACDEPGCCRGATQICTTSCSTVGLQACSNSCGWGACTPPVEICNGYDDNCDDTCDEPGCCLGTTGSCTTSCGSTGSRYCGAGCAWGACQPPVESCNGLDDDCDGACDDGYLCCLGDTETCTTCGGAGVAAGTWTCQAGCTWPASCCAPDEYCNLCDDDCDGYIDEPGPIGPALRVTNNTAESIYPTMAWNPGSSEYGIVWRDGRSGNNEIYFARVSSAGAKIGGDLRLTNNAENSSRPWIASDGSRWAVTWMDAAGVDYDIYIGTMNADGTGFLASIVTSTTSQEYYPSIVYNGNRYGIAWEDYRDSSTYGEIYLQQVNTNGTFAGGNIRVTTDGSASYNPWIEAMGNDYGVAWGDARNGYTEVYFKTVTQSGSVGSDLRVTDSSGTSNWPSLAYTGTQFGVAWIDGRSGDWQIYFARIDAAAGSKVGSDILIGSASRTDTANNREFISLVWNGSQYGLAWTDDRVAGNNEIYFARLDAAGTKIGADERVTNAALTSTYPSLVWNGTTWAVAWYDARDGNTEIYFSILGCLPSPF